MPPKIPDIENVPLFMRYTQEVLEALRAGRIAAQKPDPGPAVARKLRAALELENKAKCSGDVATSLDTEPAIPPRNEG